MTAASPCFFVFGCGYSATAFLRTRPVAEVIGEAWSNHETLTALTGSAPRWFRSGTAHYDEVAVQVVEALGETVIGFDVNGDAGATFAAGDVEASLLSAGPGSMSRLRGPTRQLLSPLPEGYSYTISRVERVPMRPFHGSSVFWTAAR